MENNNDNADKTPEIKPEIKYDTPATETAVTEGSEVSEPTGFIDKIKRLEKKHKIIGIIVICLILVFVLIAGLIWMGNGRAYREADQLLTDQKYSEALEVLKPLVEKEYKDSATLAKYIKAVQQLDKAEKTSSTSFVEMSDAYKSAETSFAAIKDFRDSKQNEAYANATADLRAKGFISTTDFGYYGEKYSKAGEIKGSAYLASFFNNLKDKKYAEAVTSAKEYQENGGILLDTKLVSLISGAQRPYNDTSAANEKINMKLELLNVGFELNPQLFDTLPNGFSFETIKSFKVKGMGSDPQGKVLVMTKSKPYKESAEYTLNISYTSLFGKDKFPKNVSEVSYVVRIYEKDSFKTWFTGGGKKVPGATQTIYAELYNVKTKKVIKKSKTKSGPGLKTQYTFSGTVPSVITPDWNKKADVKKKLVKEMVKKVNSL